MAHFYGTLKGNRGEASRLGTRNSGLRVTAASWQGRIEVTLSNFDGKDYFQVHERKHHGAGVDRLIAEGVIGEPDTAQDVRD